jgi:hypothetical protein
VNQLPQLGPATSESSRSASFSFLAAIVNLLAAVVAVYAQLPKWFVYLLGGVGVLGLAVLVYSTAWPQIRIALKGRSDRQRLDRLSHELFTEFEGYVQAFKEFISINRNDTLAGYLIELRNQSPALQAKVPPTPQLTFMSNFFGLFVRQLNQWDRSYSGLNELANQFFWFMHEFDGMYVRQQLSVFRTLSKEELSDSARNRISLYRENYAAFLREYMSFAKRANAKVGSKPFPEYIQLPEPL